MKHAKSMSALIATHFKLSTAQSPQAHEERSYIDQVSYSNTIGNLVYAMVCTQPNISHAISMAN